MKELWKDVIGYSGYYQVSNLGRLKALSRKIINGGVFHNKKERIGKQKPGRKDGYVRVTLHKEGKREVRLLHTLIARSFLQNLENRKEINHVNGVKEDNRLENLEWSTRSKNVQHAFDTGLAQGMCGKNNPACKYDDIKALTVLSFPKIPRKELAEKTGTTIGFIKGLRRGKRKSISGAFEAIKG